MEQVEQLADGDIAQFTVGLWWEQRFSQLDFVYGHTSSGDPRGIDLEISRYLLMNQRWPTDSLPSSVFMILIFYWSVELLPEPDDQSQS